MAYLPNAAGAFADLHKVREADRKCPRLTNGGDILPALHLDPDAGVGDGLRQLNPTPDSDEEDSAVLDGVSGRPLDMFGSGDPIYFGVAVSCGGRTAVLPSA